VTGVLSFIDINWPGDPVIQNDVPAGAARIRLQCPMPAGITAAMWFRFPVWSGNHLERTAAISIIKLRIDGTRFFNQAFRIVLAETRIFLPVGCPVSESPFAGAQSTTP